MKFPGFTAGESLYTARRSYAGSKRNLGGSAVQAAMTPQECYKRDVNCTRFCAQVKDSRWRYECFSRCDIYLDNCLGRGVWTDQSATLTQG